MNTKSACMVSFAGGALIVTLCFLPGANRQSTRIDELQAQADKLSNSTEQPGIKKKEVEDLSIRWKQYAEDQHKQVLALQEDLKKKNGIVQEQNTSNEEILQKVSFLQNQNIAISNEGKRTSYLLKLSREIIALDEADDRDSRRELKMYEKVDKAWIAANLLGYSALEAENGSDEKVHLVDSYIAKYKEALGLEKELTAMISTSNLSLEQRVQRHEDIAKELSKGT